MCVAVVAPGDERPEGWPPVTGAAPSDAGLDAETTPTVLVVEDDADLADLYATWLAEHCEVRVANAGEAALERLDAEVDVVLLDRRMPRLSGDEVLSAIRERGVDCRVAMVTAVEPDFDIVEMGLDDYLVKPVSGDELVETVDRLLLRSTYDEQVQELFALASKKALLRAKKAEAELRASEEYARLEDRLAVLRAETDDTVSELLDQDAHDGLAQDLLADSG